MFNTRQFDVTPLNSPGLNTANTLARSTVSVTGTANVSAKSTVSVLSDASVHVTSTMNVALEVNIPAKTLINVSSDASTEFQSSVTILKLIEIYLLMQSREFEVKAIADGVTHDSTSVVAFDIEDRLIPSEDFTIGAVIASKLSIQIRTSDTIPANASIAPYVRLNGDMGPTDWIPLGVYFVDTRGYQNSIWTFSCYDKLILSQQPYVSVLTYPATMAAVFSELCGQLGVTADPSVVINPAYMIPYHDLDVTMHDMLSYIASAHGASVRITKDTEQIAFVKFSPTADEIPILASDYFKVLQTNPLKTYTAACLTYNKDGEKLTSGVGDSDHTLNFYNPFMNQTMLDSIMAEINGFSYTPFTMDWRGNPTLDIGAPVIVTQRDGTTLSSILLTNKSSYKGGLKATVTAPSYSPQRSETNYTGSIKQSIQQLGQSSVQLEKPYYGVTIGRDSGIAIERSDGVSKATFNSDTIEIQRDGSDVFKVNPDGYVELTGVIINGGTITWGAGGANAPTPAEVGALPDGWTPDLSAYVTDTHLTTKLGQDYIVTGKIAANQIAVGTLCGMTLTGATINAVNYLNINPGGVYTSGSGIKFGTDSISYSKPILISNYQAPTGSAGGFWIDGQDNILNTMTITGFKILSLEQDLEVIGDIYAVGRTVVAGAFSGNASSASSLSQAITHMPNGCYFEALSDGLRMHLSATTYLYIGTAGCVAYVNGVSHTLA